MPYNTIKCFIPQVFRKKKEKAKEKNEIHSCFKHSLSTVTLASDRTNQIQGICV